MSTRTRRAPWEGHSLPAGAPRLRPLALSHLGISPAFVGHYAGLPVRRTKVMPAGSVTALSTPIGPPVEVNLFDPATYAAIEREELPVGVALTRGGRAYHRELVVGDAERFADPYVEAVYRQALADVVETVRAGLAHLVPRDPTEETLLDLYRPTPARPYRPGGPA